MSDGVSDARLPATNGANLALAMGAAALLVPTAAFLWWWVFGIDTDWTPDSTYVLMLGAVGAAALATVPLLGAGASRSLRWAKLAYVIGACFAFGAIGLGMWQALHQDDESEDGNAGNVSQPCSREAKALDAVPARRSLIHRA